MLLNMATTWESLAINRKVHISRLERMKAIETGPVVLAGRISSGSHQRAKQYGG
jgi:hypothetical protein